MNADAYAIVCGDLDRLSLFEEKVNNYLDHRYELLGSPSVNSGCIYQAVVIRFPKADA